MGVGLGIAVVRDLRHSLSGRAVELILKDIDIARCLYHAVGTALRRRLLVVDRVAATADQTHDQIYRVLELTLMTLLTVALAHRIRNACQEVVQQIVEVLRLAMVQGFLQFVGPAGGWGSRACTHRPHGYNP